MCQSGYIRDVLARFNMQDCKPVKTPLVVGVKLKSPSDKTAIKESLQYRELVGALMYIAIGTRPDIAYAVSLLGKFSSNYDRKHWEAAKRVLRYLRGTIHKKLVFSCNSKGLAGYSDTDWGNCIVDQRSYSGYSFILSGAAMSWCSRKQRTVALSSTGAEYMALTEAVKEAAFLIDFLKEIGCEDLIKIAIYFDNQSAGKLAQNPVFHARYRHIDKVNI